MAAELSMNGRKKIETIQKEFTNKFNYLTLLFLDEKRKSLDISKSLSEVRNVKGTDISINAGLKVNTLEARFRDNYGLMVEVAYLKDGKVMHTKDNVDKTLNEMNRWCEETGCDKFEFKKSLKGDTVLSLQEQLFNAISEQYPDAVAKKMNKDNFMDVHLPSVNAKKGTHIFFNTAKVGIKFGFYCRDEAFIKSVLDKSSNIEEYAQGVRPVGNLLFTDVEEAIEATLEFLSQFPCEDIDEVENRYEDEISENETQENSDESDEYETFIDEDDESGEEEEENDDDDDDEDEDEDEELTVIQNAQPKKEYEKIEGLIKIISDAPEQIVFAPKEIYNDTINVDKILAANKDCFVYFPEEIKNSHEAILSALQNGYYDAEMVGHLPIDDNAKLLSIVEKVPDIYVDIPEDKRTEEITKAAFFGMSTLLITDSKIELSHIPNSIQKNKNFWKQLVLECCKNCNTLHYDSGYFLTFLNDSVKKFLGKLFSDDKEVVLSHGNIMHAEKSLQDNLDFLKQMLKVHPSEIMQLNEFDLSDNDYCELAKIALAQDPYQYQNIKDEFKENIELIESALESKKQCYIIHHIPKSLLKNPELIYKLLENNDAQIKELPSFVFENEEVVENIIKIISKRVDCLLYASDRLMLDKNFLTQILDNNPLALIFAEKEILDDIDFIKKYLLAVPQLVKYVSDEVKSNKSLVIELLKINGLIIQYLDEDLASDPEIYWQALKQNVNAYNHFSNNSDVKENNDVLEYISKMDGTLLQGVSVTDKKVFLQALINSSNDTVISDESIYITSDFKNCQKSDIVKQLKLDPSQFYFLEEKDINSDLETLRQVITFTPYPIKWESCRKLLDRKEWLDVLSNNPWYFKYLTYEEKLDEQIIEIILTSNGLTFQLLSQDQRKNKKYITIAANQNIHAWKFYEGDYESIFDEMITESVQKDSELIGVFMKMNGFDKYGNDFIKALALDHQVKKFAEVSIFDHEIVPEDCFTLLIQDPNYLNHDQIVISENNLKAAFKNKSIEKDYDWDAVYENTNSINLLQYALKYIPDFGLYELIKKKDKSFDINKVISSIHIIHEPQFYSLLFEENKHKLAPYLLRSNNMNFEEKLNLLPSRLKIDFNLFSDFLKDKSVKDNYSLKPDLDELSNLLSKDFLIQLIKPLAEAGYNLFELDSIGNIWQEDREILTIVVAIMKMQLKKL